MTIPTVLQPMTSIIKSFRKLNCNYLGHKFLLNHLFQFNDKDLNEDERLD